MNVHHGCDPGWHRTAAWVACIACIAISLTACGQPQPSPLQSPIQPTSTATATAGTVTTTPVRPTVAQPSPTVGGPPPIAPTTATPLFVPTVARTPDFLPTAFGTPDTQGTSQAVVATLTALAIQPTAPPAATRRPVGAGPNEVVARPNATPMPTLDPSGVSLLSLSNKVYPGGAVALTIRTQPDAVCTLQIARTQADGSVKTDPAPGGASRQAGGDGIIAWIWQVAANEPVGALTLLVNCRAAGAAQFTIEVAQ